MIRLLIVDDSILFRNQIQLALKDCPDVLVVGTASNGKAALEMMATSDADFCILDIEMPVMDGLTTLKEMRLRNISLKTIMFSAQSKSGADKTLEAMELGAIDFIPKPQADGSSSTPAGKIREALLPKIRSLFEATGKAVTIPGKTRVDWRNFQPAALVIASSTGGPNALMEFFQELRGTKIPIPIFVTQHMPPIFTTSLAEQIGKISGLPCREGIDGEVVKPGHIYVAPGSFHMLLKEQSGAVTIELRQGELRNFVRPAADFLFETAGRIYAHKTLGIVLTGMGRDGADGARLIKTQRGVVLIQDEKSSVVYGMPGAVLQDGNSDFAAPPCELGQKFMQLCGTRGHNNVA